MQYFENKCNISVKTSLFFKAITLLILPTLIIIVKPDCKHGDNSLISRARYNHEKHILIK